MQRRLSLPVLLSLLAASIAAVAVSGCAVRGPGGNIRIAFNLPGANKATEKVQKSFLAGKVNTLQVEATAGDITIEPMEDGNDVIQIWATKTITGDVSPSELKKYLGNIAVTATLQGGTLVVKADIAQSLPDGISGYVSYAIKVPKRLSLDLHTVSGDIKAHDVQGGGSVESSSGDIVLEKMQGDWSGKTVGGGMTLKSIGICHQITLNSASGDLELEDIQGDLDATTVSGAVKARDIHNARTIHVNTASGDAHIEGVQAAGNSLSLDLSSVSGELWFRGDATNLKLHSSSGDIHAETSAVLALASADIHNVSGGVTIKLPSSVSANADFHTVSGTIATRGADNIMPVGEDNRSLKTVMGSGGAPLNIDTSSGDITLELSSK